VLTKCALRARQSLSELDKYVFDKELQHADDYIFCVPPFCILLRVWQNKLPNINKNIEYRES
jgi:hypothetical protein